MESLTIVSGELGTQPIRAWSQRSPEELPVSVAAEQRLRQRYRPACGIGTLHKTPNPD